jgi:hypothetical protein
VTFWALVWEDSPMPPHMVAIWKILVLVEEPDGQGRYI